MTYKEYLTQTLSGLNIPDGDIDIILLKEGLNPGDVVDAKAADTAVYNRFTVVIKASMQNISEGGYSISWNMDAVKMFYNALCNELGTENVLMSGPRVRDKSSYW